jgi:hypothetical protein
MNIYACHYLTVPAAEVDVKRFFNSGQNLLGLRRWALGSKTMKEMNKSESCNRAVRSDQLSAS